MPGLPLDQPLRPTGAIEQQIGSKIFFDFVGNRLGRFSNPIDNCISQTRERHFCWIDDVGLRIPFCGERLR